MTKNKTLFKAIVKISLLSLVLAMSMFQFSVLPTKASGLTNLSDTLSDLTENKASNHKILFITPSGVDAG